MRFTCRPKRIGSTRFATSCGWRKIEDKRHYFRSRWEANYARYLQWMKSQKLILDWQFEPQTFWFESIKRGVRSYLPDFKVIRMDSTHYWVEVKGFYDRKSMTKIKRFNKYYSHEELRLVDKSWFLTNSTKLSKLILSWEK